MKKRLFFYAADISKKVRSAFRARAANGEHLAGKSPYGYTRHPDDKHRLVVDDEAASVVRRAFQLASEGLSPQNIALKFFQERILTPSALDNQRTGHFHSRYIPGRTYSWSDATVRRMLTNKIYLGCMVNHRETIKSFKNKTRVIVPEDEWIIVEGAHEPLVDRDLFERVQRLVSIKKRENKANLDNIFVSVIFCADCGRRHFYANHGGYAGGKGGYTCGGYRASAFKGMERLCSPHSIPFAYLYETVKKSLCELSETAVDVPTLLRRIEERADVTETDSQKSLERAKRRRADLKRLIKNAFEQQSLGRLDSAVAGDLLGDYQAEYKALGDQIEEIESRFTANDEKSKNAQLLVDRVKRYASFETLTRETVLDLIDRIEIHEAERNGRERKVKVDVYFKFVGKLPDARVSL